MWPLEAMAHTPHDPNGILEKNNFGIASNFGIAKSSKKWFFRVFFPFIDIKIWIIKILKCEFDYFC